MAYGMSDDLNEWRAACFRAEKEVEQLKKQVEYWKMRAHANTIAPLER